MDLAHQLDRNLQLLGRLEQLIIAQGDNVADLLLDLAHVTHGLNDVARARLAFGADHRGALGNTAQRLAQIAGATDKRHVKLGLVDVVDIVGGGEDLGFVDVVDLDGLKDLRLDDVTDAALCHDGDRDGLLNALDHLGVTHARHAAGGVSRMSDPKMIKGIQEAVSIPVMAKCRIGHIVEAQVLQAIEIDYIDESEVLSPADDVYHIDKTQFDVPFVCGARDLGEALRRVAEGATMIRTKGEPGTGDVVQAVRHMRKIQKQIRDVVALRDDELFEAAKQLQVPIELVREVHTTGKLPVVNFAAGGIATPADAALMMQLGAEGVFVGSGIFKSGDPAKRAAAIVKAVANFTDAKLIAELSEDLGEAMVGINADEIEIIMEERGR